MHPELAKLIDTGRLSKQVGERLTQLAPGRFCLHKAFGAGKVLSWDLPGKRITIDFEKSPGQVMDLQFAIQKTEPIPEDDFRARKIEQIEELRALADTDPAELLVRLLESHGGAMTAVAIEQELAGAVIPQDKFKKWWTDAKKALKESLRAAVPSKRTEPIIVRPADQTPARTLLAELEAARDPKSIFRALDFIAKDIEAFADEPEALKRLLLDIDQMATKSARVKLAHALQMIATRDEIVNADTALELDPEAIQLADIVRGADMEKLIEAVAELPFARQRIVFEAFPAAFGDEWTSRLIPLFDRTGARGATEIARILEENGALPQLLETLRSALARRTLAMEGIIWLSRERKGAAAPVFCPDLGARILGLLESDHLADGPRKTSRLQSLVVNDKTLLADLAGAMDVNEARSFAGRLLECPVFGELERKSLLARIIKVRPDTAELVAGSSHKRDDSLVVSWESLDAKKEELNELITVRIPQNTKDIAIARSYGDLRENFEYKSAKEMQRYLGQRRHELERDIARARGTDFKGSEADSVNIGTVATLSNANGETVEFTVLGAWDSDPDRNIVSYLSEVGKELLGLRQGESATIPDPENGLTRTLTVTGIRPYLT